MPKLMQIIRPPKPEHHGLFGVSVALCGKDRMLVGARRENGLDGAAHFYVHEGGTWKLSQSINTPTGCGKMRFGHAVALTDKYALIGAPGITSDCDDETVPAPTGQAFLYQRDGSNWTLYNGGNGSDLANWQIAGAAAADQHTGHCDDMFGETVAMTNNTAIVAAPSHRFAYTQKIDCKKNRRQTRKWAWCTFMH